jgi:hypothetical protein
VAAAISPNGRPNMSCSTNATRSAGASVSSTTSMASPTESASTASCSGPAAAMAWSTASGSSRRDLRVRSMSRHTRATMVVSHPSRFATSPAPARPAWIHASWTASSASLSEPSIR